MEINENDKTSEDGKPLKRHAKIRDLFTDRIVGIVGGACIPVILLFIPVINKYLDNTKEIQRLQIENNAKNIEDTNNRLNIITQAFAQQQIKSQELTDRLSLSVVNLKKITENLKECEHGCEPVCAKLGFIRKGAR